MSEQPTKTVSAKVPEDLHKRFDTYCKEKAYNKSAVLRLLMSGLISGSIKLVDSQQIS